VSAAAIEQEIAQYQEMLGYKVVFNDNDHVYIFFNNTRIAHHCTIVEWRAHSRLAKAALRTIRDHQKAMTLLSGVVVA